MWRLGDVCDPVQSVQTPLTGSINPFSKTMSDDSGDQLLGSYTTYTMTLSVVSAVQALPPGVACAEYCGWTQNITPTRSGWATFPGGTVERLDAEPKGQTVSITRRSNQTFLSWSASPITNLCGQSALESSPNRQRRADAELFYAA